MKSYPSGTTPSHPICEVVFASSVLFSDTGSAPFQICQAPTPLDRSRESAPASSREAIWNSIRAAFYARVSREHQAVAHTINSQLAALSERAQADGSRWLGVKARATRRYHQNPKRAAHRIQLAARCARSLWGPIARGGSDVAAVPVFAVAAGMYSIRVQLRRIIGCEAGSWGVSLRKRRFLRLELHCAVC